MPTPRHALRPPRDGDAGARQGGQPRRGPAEQPRDRHRRRRAHGTARPRSRAGVRRVAIRDPARTETSGRSRPRSLRAGQTQSSASAPRTLHREGPRPNDAVRAFLAPPVGLEHRPFGFQPQGSHEEYLRLTLIDLEAMRNGESTGCRRACDCMAQRACRPPTGCAQGVPREWAIGPMHLPPGASAQRPGLRSLTSPGRAAHGCRRGSATRCSRCRHDHRPLERPKHARGAQVMALWPGPARPAVERGHVPGQVFSA